MSDFTPNGILYILKNVPLDPDYEKTLYFDDEQTQFDYFKSKRDTTLSWENRQYQKVGKGTLRVKALADKLYDCNYLMFQNRKYGNGNKWFYAFIREVRYINDDTSEIVYTLDVMQTWLFQYKDSMEECYVEREHTVSDLRYGNTVAEDVPSGDYITNEREEYSPAFNSATGKYSWNIVIVTTEPVKYELFTDDTQESIGVCWVSPKNTFTRTEGVTTTNYDYCFEVVGRDSRPKVPTFPKSPFSVAGIITPLYVYTFDSVQIISKREELRPAIRCYGNDFNGRNNYTVKVPTSLKSFLFAMNPEAIVFGTYYPSGYGTKLDEISTVKTSVLNFNLNNQNEFYSRDGNTRTYTPKNQKMYCSPFSVLEVTNNAGGKQTFAFENFRSSNTIGQKFKASGTAILNTEIRLTPYEYAGEGDSPYLDRSLIINNLPQLAFTIDTYRQYLNNNGSRFAAGVIGDVVNLGMGVALGKTGTIGIASAASKGVGAIQGLMDKYVLLQDKKNQADSVMGAVNDTSVAFANNEIRFELRTKRVNAELAKIIDEYFTRYGYKCMQIKKPNLKARPYFTYTKTIQCEINASIPQDDLENIKGVFNMGTTFWYINEPTTGVFPQDDLIGKYLTVDNQPITTTGV